MSRKRLHQTVPPTPEATTNTPTPPPRDPEGLAAWLSRRYGRVILTIPEAAAELAHSENALRVALWSKSRTQQQPVWLRQIRRGRVRMGRHLYIGVHALADVLLNGDRSIVESDDEVGS